MASSSSRLALRLCSSIRGQQHHSRAFAASAASVCGETAAKAAGASTSTATATKTAASNSSSAANASSSSSTSNNARPLAYVFLGAPGVGKGTYSTRVADALGAEHVSAGDLVRAEVKKGSELGKQVRRRGCCLFFLLPAALAVGLGPPRELSVTSRRELVAAAASWERKERPSTIISALNNHQRLFSSSSS